METPRLLLLLRLARPEQWVKNLVLFLPLFFGQAIADPARLCDTAHLAMVFCLVSSAVYLFNDLLDAPQDRQHPLKCHRPIASGAVTPAAAVLFLLILLLGAGALLYAGRPVGPEVLLLLGGYLALNAAYTLWLKQIPLVDATVLALGFVIRLHAGGCAAAIPVSHWLDIMVFLLALLLALGKRADDLRNFRQTGRISRKSVTRYTEGYLQALLTILSTLLATLYILYTLAPEVCQRSGDRMYCTIPIALLGIMRYLQIILVEKRNSNPTGLFLHDRFLQLTLACWLLAFTLILY